MYKCIQYTITLSSGSSALGQHACKQFRQLCRDIFTCMGVHVYCVRVYLVLAQLGILFIIYYSKVAYMHINTLDDESMGFITPEKLERHPCAALGMSIRTLVLW